MRFPTHFLTVLSPLITVLFAACGGASAGGVPEDCEVCFDGECYSSSADACAAASCPTERCLILETYPGQVDCQEAVPPEPGTDESVSSPVAEGGRCDETTQCAEGLSCDGVEGCDVEWTCQPMRACTRDLVTYCGCDGETFHGGGNCPGRPFSARGPCPDGGEG